MTPSPVDGVAVVTGAAGGIGRSVVLRMRERGWQVVEHRHTASPDASADDLIVIGDLATADGIDAIVAATRALVADRGICMLVQCAARHDGAHPLATARAVDLATVNLVAPYAIAEGLIDLMLPGSTSVLVSSIAASRATPGTEFYGATKAGIEALVAALAYRHGPAGVRVVGVAPGLVRTPMSRDVWNDADTAERLARANPSGRLGDPEDIADIVLALGSSDFRWVTGQVITADGGSLLGFGDEVWTATGVAAGFATADATRSESGATDRR